MMGLMIEPSERDAPELEQLGITGVLRASFRTVTYNSSLLVEPHRRGWPGFFDEPIDHLYWIVTQRGVHRAWGRHQQTTDRYAVVLGTVEVALIDGRNPQGSDPVPLIVALDGAAGEGLLIPPGVWHTFRSTTDQAVLLNSKSPPFEPDDVDKQVLPMPNDQFSFVWGS